jgi:hypothetical protein
MALLMEDIESNLKLFLEARGYNSKIISEGKLGENEDPEKELRKELEKEKLSSSAITPP